MVKCEFSRLSSLEAQKSQILIYSIVDNYSVLNSWLKDELTILGLRTDQPRPPPPKKKITNYSMCGFTGNVYLGTVLVQYRCSRSFILIFPLYMLGREMSVLLNNDESFVPTEKLF